MNVYFSKRAEKGLEKVFSHVLKYFGQKRGQAVRDDLVATILKLGKFPEMGAKIAGQADKRVLIFAGNLVVYEILLSKDPVIVIRNIRPRGTLAKET